MEECLIFQQNKVEKVKILGLLQPLDVPCQHGEEVLMGFITCLPKSKEKNHIMEVVDRFTKYAHLCALCHLFNVGIIAATFT